VLVGCESEIIFWLLCVFICSFPGCVCVCVSSGQLKCLQGGGDNEEGESGLQLREGGKYEKLPTEGKHEEK